MKKAFTMIELIFVIVIIGILAAVAIPKLAATRDDAKISSIIGNVRTALGDMSTFYMARGNTYWRNIATTDEVTRVVIDTSCSGDQSTGQIVGSSLLFCDEKSGNACIILTPDVNGTMLNVEAGTSGSSIICDAVIADPAIIGLTGGAGQNKDHRLGGVSVTK